MSHLSFLRTIRLVVAAAPLALLSIGCVQPGHFDSARKGPFYQPANYLGEPSLGGIRRVVVLPLWGGDVATEETVADLDPTILTALQHQRRFEVVSLSREDALRKFRTTSFSSAAALPHDLMAYLASEYAAEAVLFIDLTVYKPYPPLAVGFRAKLATIDGARLVWTFDDLFSADDARVANGARNHFLDLDRRIPADMTHGVLQSPSRFATYATTAMFATLPPVLPPPVVKPEKLAKN